MAFNKYIPRIVMKVAGEARRRNWEANNPETLGAKVIVHDGERLVLIRNNYGNPNNFLRPSTTWDIPGGGLKKDEASLIRAQLDEGMTAQEIPPHLFIGAAMRELEEEIGLQVEETDLHHVDTVRSFESGNRDTIGIFALKVADVTAENYTFQRNEIHAAEAHSVFYLPEDRREYIGSAVSSLALVA